MSRKVEDIMTRRVLTVASDASLEDVSWGLSLKQVHGAPVKDDRGRLIGVLSKSDIHLLERIPPGADKLKASDAMTPILYAIKASDPVKQAARRFVQTGAHQLIVLDEDGKMVGIVSQKDIIELLLEDDVSL